jgi:hypothetical protein
MRFSHQFLHSLRENEHMSWLVCLQELISNSVEQEATGIIATWQGREFSMLDNGLGVSPGGFEALWTLGGHLRPPVKKSFGVGRYGIGFKEATGWLWGEVEIASRHQGRRGQLRWSWDEEAKKGVEATQERAPVIWQNAKATRSGTRIVCRNIRRNTPRAEQVARYVDELQHMYRPALEGGVQITLVKGDDPAITLRPSPWPEQDPRTPVIDTVITIGGRAVSIRAMVTKHEQARHGIFFAKGGQATERLTTRYSSPFIYGWVMLGDEWELSKNKSAIVDELRADLMEQVEEASRPVLEAARKLGELLRLIGLEQNINYRLRNGLANTLIAPGRKGGNQLYKKGLRRPVNPDPDPKHEPDPIGPVDVKKKSPPKPNRHAKQLIGTAPEIRVIIGETKTGMVSEYDLQDYEWIVTLNRETPYVLEYLTHGTGMIGDEAERAFAHILAGLAAQAVHNPTAKKAMPWLENEPTDMIYELAHTKLWADYLAAQVAEKEAVAS